MCKNELRDRRLELYPNITAAEFCSKVGMGCSTLSNYENGIVAAPQTSNMDVIDRYARALDFDTSSVLTMISNNYHYRRSGKLHINQPGRNTSKSNILVDWRLNQGYTTKDVADVLGVSRATYSAWENGVNKPTGENLKNLVDLTGLSMHQIASISVRENTNKVTTTVVEETTSEEITTETVTRKETTVMEETTKTEGKYLFIEDSDAELVEEVMKLTYGHLDCDKFMRLHTLLMEAINNG